MLDSSYLLYAFRGANGDTVSLSLFLSLHSASCRLSRTLDATGIPSSHNTRISQPQRLTEKSPLVVCLEIQNLKSSICYSNFWTAVAHGGR